MEKNFENEKVNTSVSQITIDLSKIETIGLKSGYNYIQMSCSKRNNENHSEILGIGFVAMPGYEIEELIDGELSHSKDVGFPFGGLYRDWSNNSDDYKIIKAFNHLRKLCGAPEPISFD